MKLDVLADLDHLFMINFSAPAEQLAPLVPAPLRVLVRGGRGFPSIVLPRVENLRPSTVGFPRVSYELFGLRILVSYESARLGPTKGIYFRRLIMDPDRVRRAANLLTPFSFERGRIVKRPLADGSVEVSAGLRSGEDAIHAKVRASGHFPSTLPATSCFSSAEEALAMYNDIAFGFLPGIGGTMHVLQIAELHPNYVAWPLRHLEIDEHSLRVGLDLAELDVSLEPCYFVERLARYWRWLPSEAPAFVSPTVPAPAALRRVRQLGEGVIIAQWRFFRALDGAHQVLGVSEPFRVGFS